VRDVGRAWCNHERRAPCDLGQLQDDVDAQRLMMVSSDVEQVFARASEFSRLYEPERRLPRARRDEQLRAAIHAQDNS
jgi:hypothetical protein